MATPLSLVVEHLPHEKKVLLLEDAINHLEKSEYVETAALVSSVATDSQTKLVLQYCCDEIKADNTKSYPQIVSLVKAFYLHKEIRSFLHQPVLSFITKPFQAWTDQFPHPEAGEETDVSVEQLEPLLHFLEYWFCHQADSGSEGLDTSLLLLLGVQNTSLGNSASQILRWRMNQLETPLLTVWKAILALVSSSVQTQRSWGFITWLRYINGADSLRENSDYQKILASDDYWRWLCSGLASTSSDHRRFALSILQISVQYIKTNIHNEYLEWRVEDEEKHLNSWGRFITYYEIVAIDTSLHQAEAASGDILKLLAPDSLVKPQWGLSLLSTGFRADMDNVRRFVLGLLLSLSSQSLPELGQVEDTLTEVILPYALSAHHFSMVKEMGKITCPYGTQWYQFVASAVGESPQLATIFINYLAANQTFDPARIYTLGGIVEGLPKNMLQADEVSESVVTLMRYRAQSPLFDRALQTLHFSILMKLKYHQSVVDIICGFNRWDIVSAYRHELKEYLGDVIPLKLQGLWGTHSPANIGPVLLSKLPVSDASVVVQALENEEYLESLVAVDFESYKSMIPSDLDFLWSRARQLLASENYDDVEKGSTVVRVFTNVYLHSPYFLSWDSLRTPLLLHSSKLSKESNNFYKLKDGIEGCYWQVLASTLAKTDVVNSEISEWLFAQFNPQLAFEATEAQMKIGKLLIGCINSDKLVDFLANVWHTMANSRLSFASRRFQIDLISLLLSSEFMAVSEKDEAVASSLSSVCMSIIENCSGRRSLWPTMAKCLLSYKNIESLPWTVEIIIRGYLVSQVSSSIFQGEQIVDSVMKRLGESGDWYREVYGDEEVSARVYLLALFNRVSTASYANHIVSFIAENESEFNFRKVNRRADAYEEWVRVQISQILVSVVDIATIDAGEFLELMLVQPSPWVRVYFEWIVAHHMVTDMSLVDLALEKATKALAPSQLNGLLRMVFLASKQMSVSNEVTVLTRLIPLVVAQASSNRASVRHFSLSLSCSIHDEICEKSLNLDPSLLSVTKSLYETVSAGHQLGVYRPGDAQLWDISDLSLVSIGGEVLMKTSDRDTYDWIFAESYNRYLGGFDLRHPIGSNHPQDWILTKKEATKQKSNTTTDTMLQTKSGAWSTFVDVESERGSDVVRSDLIVVASLVDKPPNLGGICRLSDVLGAGMMTVDDLKVRDHPSFKSVAVTADRWMPIEEVKMDSIGKYLREKKRQGYTLVGLEQTDQSVQLSPEVKFPKKSVFLLGKEREGIPGYLLAELDFCVEIKQVGVIRSMNIQTATAVLVHAYASQHC